MREAIGRDIGLFSAFEETMRAFGQWLCGRCMSIHALSRACHHPDEVVRFSDGGEEGESRIVGILRPTSIGPEVICLDGGLVLDAGLLERVLEVPIITVKSIPHGCRLAFSQTLKDTLYKVVAEPSSVVAWVQLLLLPRCTLQVVRPTNRRERRSGNRKSLQLHNILESLAIWRETDGIAKLVGRILASPVFMGSDADEDRIDEGGQEDEGQH